VAVLALGFVYALTHWIESRLETARVGGIGRQDEASGRAD
jgi:hypothetical protein